MNRDAVRAVLGRDLGAVRRSKAVMLPMLLVPTVLLVLLPLSIGLAANSRTPFDVGPFVKLLPHSLAKPVLTYPQNQRLVVLVLGYLVAPLFLIVPLMVSAVLAADAFAGEKERKTLETLLHLPVETGDLYFAKLMAGFLPSVVISWIGFVIFVAISDAVAWPVMHRAFLPTTLWMIVIIWVAPGVSALGLGIMIRVSARAANTQEAQQLGGAVVLPLIILAVGQTTGLLLAGPLVSIGVGAVIWVIAIFLNVRGMQTFTRNRMASRL
ncbi:MAG TPA: ABC transporter permease subunit [Acidimicrobiales bacterium]